MVRSFVSPPPSSGGRLTVNGHPRLVPDAGGTRRDRADCGPLIVSTKPRGTKRMRRRTLAGSPARRASAVCPSSHGRWFL
jgi:hypothetical protein